MWRPDLGALPTLVARGALAMGSALLAAPVVAAEAPVVRIVTPSPASYLLPADGTSLLIAIEVTDVDGSGLELDAERVPRFVDPDENVQLFRRHLVETSTYTTHEGRTVTQMIARVASSSLARRLDGRVTGPFDGRNLTEKQRLEGWFVPEEGIVEFASFHFVVRSRSGLTSPAEQRFQGPGILNVGFAGRLYVPPE